MAIKYQVENTWPVNVRNSSETRVDLTTKSPNANTHLINIIDSKRPSFWHLRIFTSDLIQWKIQESDERNGILCDSLSSEGFFMHWKSHREIHSEGNSCDVTVMEKTKLDICCTLMLARFKNILSPQLIKDKHFPSSSPA